MTIAERQTVALTTEELASRLRASYGFDVSEERVGLWLRGWQVDGLVEFEADRWHLSVRGWRSLQTFDAEPTSTTTCTSTARRIVR